MLERAARQPLAQGRRRGAFRRIIRCTREARVAHITIWRGVVSRKSRMLRVITSHNFSPRYNFFSPYARPPPPPHCRNRPNDNFSPHFRRIRVFFTRCPFASRVWLFVFWFGMQAVLYENFTPRYAKSDKNAAATLHNDGKRQMTRFFFYNDYVLYSAKLETFWWFVYGVPRQ